MDDYAKLARALKQPQQNGTTLVGTVRAVNGLTCTVQVAEYIYKDVRLRVTDDTLTDYELRTPTVGTEVVILDVSDGAKTDFVVLLAEQCDKIEFKKGATTLTIDDKIKVLNGTTTTEISDKVTVKALLNEFEIDATGIKIANATANLKPIVANLQAGVATFYTLIGDPRLAQVTADIALLNTLLK